MSFKITGGKGFHIEFPNGYRVSVQLGGGNYSANYDEPIVSHAKNLPESHTAEVAVIAPIAPGRENNGGLLRLPGWSDTVQGYVDSLFVAELIATVVAWPKPKTDAEAMAPWGIE